MLLLFSPWVLSDSLQPHGLQHARLPCPSPSPRVWSNSCPLSQRCYPTISSSVIPFSSRLQSFPASGSFPMSQLFASGSQSIGASAAASVLPINIQGWFPIGFTDLILLSPNFSIFALAALSAHPTTPLHLVNPSPALRSSGIAPSSVKSFGSHPPPPN